MRGWLWLVGGAIAVVLLACGGYVVWDRDFRTAGPTNPGTICPPVVTPRHGRLFAAPGVHRVALIGDSILDSASCAVAESLADVGIQTSRHAVPGSGLLDGPVDWVTETQRILAAEEPDVVIAEFVGNYGPGTVRDAQGTPIVVDTPAFFTAWQSRAAAISAEVRAAHARLYWVSPPPIGISLLQHAQRLFDGYRSLTSDHFLDSGRALAGPNGREIRSKQTCGRNTTIRSLFDGIHLTDDGARIYGQQIAHDFTADVGLLTAPRPC